MPYLNKRKDFEVGRIYTPSKDQKRSDPTHWHNSYFIPIENLGRSRFKVIVVSKANGAKVEDTDNWSEFVKNSFFADLTDNLTFEKYSIMRSIFKDQI